jgi:hypothetical protein
MTSNRSYKQEELLMIKHCILHFNPQADYEWDRCVLRNPLTGERLDLTQAIAEAVKKQVLI